MRSEPSTIRARQLPADDLKHRSSVRRGRPTVEPSQTKSSGAPPSHGVRATSTKTKCKYPRRARRRVVATTIVGSGCWALLEAFWAEAPPWSRFKHGGCLSVTWRRSSVLSDTLRNITQLCRIPAEAHLKIFFYHSSKPAPVAGREAAEMAFWPRVFISSTPLPLASVFTPETRRTS